MPGLRVERTARPVGAAGVMRQPQGGELAVGPGDDRRQVRSRGRLVLIRGSRSASAFSSGVKSMRSSVVTPWRSNGAGLVGKRLRRRRPLAGHVGLRHGPLLDRPHRLAGRAIEDEGERLLRDLRDRLDLLAADRDVGEDRRRRRRPSPRCRDGRAGSARRACRSSRRGRRGCPQNRLSPRPVAAVEVAGRHLDGDVDVAELFVAGQRRPRAGVAGVLPGVVLPGLVAELAGLRDGLERPDALAGADVEAADVAGNVRLRRRRGAGDHRGADDDDVAHDDRRRARADLAGLHDVAVEAFGEIDDAVLAERGMGRPVLASSATS